MDIPTSGYERIYGDPRWETRRGIHNNNCYSYAMDHYLPYREHKAVIGNLAGYKQDIHYNTCAPLHKRILQDNKGRIYREDPEKACKPGHYKIMMVVANKQDPDGYGDFHFYKHHKDVVYTVKKGDTVASIATFFGVPEAKVILASEGKKLTVGRRLLLKDVNIFSHKRGWATAPLLDDACGKAIKDPRKACRDYSIKYNKYCGSYCVRAGNVKTSIL